VALPKDLEQMDPEFFHIDSTQIPSWTEGNIDFKLIAGEAMGKKSEVPVYSKLYMLEIKSRERQTIKIGHELYGEAGMYILEGTVESDGNIYQPKQLLIAKDSSLCEFVIEANSTVYLFGGETFPEERFIDWNFVSSSKTTLAEAREKWINQTFPKIKGEENEFVPYPSIIKK
jgi:hypothetical protein